MNGERLLRDRGEGPVGYLAAIVLLAAVLAAIAVSGAAAAVTTGTEDAICRVLSVGGIGDCGGRDVPPTAPPSPGATPTGGPTGAPTSTPTGPSPSPAPSASPSPSATPSTSGGPTPTPSTTPPVQPVQPVDRPEPVCSGDADIGYRDVTVIVPVRYVNARGSVRVFYSITKVIGKDGKVKWVVAVGGYGELGVSAPAIPFLKGAWLGGNGTGTQTYSFDNEKEAREFPLKYAQTRAKQALEYNPAIAPLLKVPFLGDKLRDFLGDTSLPPADKTGIEVGPAGGATPNITLPGEIVDLSAPTRFWSLGGVARDKDGNWILNLRDKALTDPTLMVDLSKLPRQVLQRGADAVLTYVEKQGKDKFGPEFKVPDKLRSYVATAVKRGVKAGMTVEFIGQNDLQYTLDRHGRPVKFSRSTTFSWTARLRGNVSPLDNVPITGQVPLPVFSGGRTTTNYLLDLRDPHNRAEATRLFAQGALTWKAGMGSAWNHLTPQGQRLDELFRKRGTVTELTYDESAGGLSGSVEGMGKREEGAFRLEGENGHSELTGARIWRDGQGWVPWTECHR